MKVGLAYYKYIYILLKNIIYIELLFLLFNNVNVIVNINFENEREGKKWQLYNIYKFN